MKKIAFILVSLFFVLVINLDAQTGYTKKKELTNITYSLGATAGFTTGIGLSGRAYFNNFGTMLTFAPLVNSSSVGLTFLYKLEESDYIAFLLYQGNHWYTHEEETIINNGIGFGLELAPKGVISVDLMGGFMSYDAMKHYAPTIEFSIMYSFKRKK